jgi:hypothetical protein
MTPPNRKVSGTGATVLEFTRAYRSRENVKEVNMLETWEWVSRA